MRRISQCIVALLVASNSAANALQLGQVFGLNKPSTAFTGANSKKKELLEAVSFTNNGKTATEEQQANVLKIARSLETNNPPSADFRNEIKMLDGVWYLQYTSPSVVGDADEFPDAWKAEKAEEKITTKQSKVNGSVNAAGLKVETANRIVKQIVDVANSFVTNEVELDFGVVCVGGPFRQSERVPKRVVVAFEQCDIALNNGPTLRLGFLFDVIAFFRGTKDGGWLETTYIDDSMRVGRGNKGTMFVLTRDPQDVKP